MVVITSIDEMIYSCQSCEEKELSRYALAFFSIPFRVSVLQLCPTCSHQQFRQSDTGFWDCAKGQVLLEDFSVIHSLREPVNLFLIHHKNVDQDFGLFYLHILQLQYLILMYKIKPVVLYWGDFGHWGTLGNIWRCFWLSQLEAGERYGHLVGRGQGCRAPHNNYMAQNVSSAEIEKP